MGTGRSKPVYIIYGADEHLRDEQRRRIVEETVGSADAQLAVAAFDGDAELVDVLDALRSAPLMSERRLVIVRDADVFVTAHRDALEGYLSKPSACGSLLLMVDAWLPKSNLGKAVAKVGEAVECKAPVGGRLDSWIEEAAARRGKRMDAGARAMLAELVGADLSALESEVEKLSLYAGKRGTITEEDVNLLTAATAEVEPFALANAIAAGDARGALVALDKTLTRKGLEFMVLGQIGWMLRVAVAAQALREAGKDPSPALKVRYEARPMYLGMLKRRPMRRLEADCRRVMEADLALKSGADAKATMQDLVMALCM